MSVLLAVPFALVAIFAVVVIMTTWRECASFVAELHDQLRRPDKADEIRHTVQERASSHARSNRGLLRHMHRPKPIKHRLHGRSPRRAIG